MTFRTRFTAWADAHLIPEWRSFWKLWSVRLVIPFGLLGSYFGDPANSAAWTATLYGLPPEYRKLIPGGLFIFFAFVPFIVRLWSQRKPPVPPSA